MASARGGVADRSVVGHCSLAYFMFCGVPGERPCKFGDDRRRLEENVDTFTTEESKLLLQLIGRDAAWLLTAAIERCAIIAGCSSQLSTKLLLAGTFQTTCSSNCAVGTM